jgi:hypothetical protein
MTFDLEAFLAHAWDVKVYYNRDNTIRRIAIDVRDTTMFNELMVERSAMLMREFMKEREQ